jgi:hypothetical protein
MRGQKVGVLPEERAGGGRLLKESRERRRLEEECAGRERLLKESIERRR